MGKTYSDRDLDRVMAGAAPMDIHLEEYGFGSRSADINADEDHTPPPTGLQDYGIPPDAEPVHDIGTVLSFAPKIEATPWQWRQPASLPARQWLYDRHLIRGFVSGTIAPGGLGKSSLVLVEALAMVSGRPLLGKRPSGPLKVWLYQLEDPQDEMDRRAAAACLHYDLTPADIDGRLHVNSGRDQPCVIARMLPSGATILAPVVDAIVSEITGRQIDVLVIDPFVSSHAVPENDNGAQDAVIKEWGRVAGRGNCAVELVHHARKLGDNEVTAESARGAVAFTAGCRDVRVLNRMTKDEGARADIENHRLFFRVYSDKANLAPPSDKSDWYRLHSVDLENGHMGLSDHVQVVTTWEWPNAFDGVATADLLAVQKRIAAGEWRASSQSSNWVGKAVADVLDLDLSSAPPQTKVKTLLKAWLESGALKSVKRPDEHRKEREFIEVGQWAV